MAVPSGANFKHHAILLAFNLADDMVVVSLAQDRGSHWLAPGKDHTYADYSRLAHQNHQQSQLLLVNSEWM